MYRWSNLACLVIFFSKHQPATLYRLQNKLVKVERQIQEPCHIEEWFLCDSSKWKTKTRSFLPQKTVFDYLQSWKISGTTSLLDFGLSKSDLRQSSWPKVKFKEDFLNIFYFILPFFRALFKRWINNKLEVIRVIFTSYILSYSIVLYYTQSNEVLSDHGGINS